MESTDSMTYLGTCSRRASINDLAKSEISSYSSSGSGYSYSPDEMFWIVSMSSSPRKGDIPVRLCEGRRGGGGGIIHLDIENYVHSE